MKRSSERIRVTHTGSLPRPPEILRTMHLIAAGKPYDERAHEAAIQRCVAESVQRQKDCGIDVVNDGECGKPSFLGYIGERLAGFEARIPAGGIPVPTGPIGTTGRDAQMFPEFYKNVLEHNPFERAVRLPPLVCVGPIKYVGQKQIGRDIANLKAGMAAAAVDEGFVPTSAPFTIVPNEYYRSDEEYQEAYAEAVREEYQAIIAAGLLVQIDFPHLVSSWDEKKTMDLAQYRKWAEAQVERLNHSLRGLPEESIRFHTCYGVNFGPRMSDLQLTDVIDIFFKIKAQSYSFEAANPRHEHEWRVAQKVKIPEGKILIPGMVTHSNAMIEHPEVVADHIERWARAAGRENILVGNDCGFASVAGNIEIPMTVAWAKLNALGEGARIASRRLWDSQ
jgi:5-methyltetrahydropteroyltriglutamate--homocysteine methyltransferase